MLCWRPGGGDGGGGEGREREFFVWSCVIWRWRVGLKFFCLVLLPRFDDDSIVRFCSVCSSCDERWGLRAAGSKFLVWGYLILAMDHIVSNFSFRCLSELGALQLGRGKEWVKENKEWLAVRLEEAYLCCVPVSRRYLWPPHLGTGKG